MVAKIIVNSVDVSECTYVDIEERKNYTDLIVCVACKEDITDYKECENNPNCYFKQFKRLEAEYKELKNNRKIILKNGSTISKLCSQYRKALEEVREITNKRNIGCGPFCEVNRLEHNCDAECNAYYLAQIQDKINEVLGD